MLDGDLMKIKNGTVIMVADGAKLLLFRNDGDTKYPVLSTLSHEEPANPPTREHGTDTPGRTQTSLGDRRSSYGETDWHTQSEEHFARHAAEVLEQAAAAQPEAAVVVIAAPRTLGELRKHYGRETSQRLLAEIGKDLASHMTDDIVQVIAAHNP
jgi:protein required for attachment to host cells